MDYYKLDKDKTFLVSQKALIVKDGKVLVLKFPGSKKKEWNGRWGFPGGLLEMGEKLGPGLVREVKEETGLDIKIDKPFGVGNMIYDGFVFRDGRKLKTRIIEIGFICKVAKGKVKLSYEHIEHMWVDRSELSKLDITPDSKDLVSVYLR